MKYCPYCGQQLQDDMVFCRKCGKKYPEEETNQDHDKLSNPINTPKDEVPVQKSNRPKQRNRKIGIAVVVAVCAIVALTAAIAMIVISLGNKQSKTDEVQQVQSAEEQQENTSISDASQSVLYLEVYDDQEELVATASGFLVEDHSTLVTNYHVMEDAYRIIAWTADEKTSVQIVRSLVFDKDADLAVLQCQDPIEHINPLKLEDSDQLKTGDNVYAVGYPLGLNQTISDGIISSLYEDEYGTEIVQTTAAISEGSSGGVLLNEKGLVVGVTSASYMEGQNLNIAISANELSELLNQEYTMDFLPDRYNLTHAYGLSAANLAGDGCVADTDTLLFTVEDGNTIYMQDKKSGTKRAICNGNWINVYNECLYYYNTETNEICCYDWQTEREKTILQLPQETTDLGWGDLEFCETVGMMLLAENSIFLRLDIQDSPDIKAWGSYLAVIDLEKPEEYLYFSKVEITNFTYLNSQIYAGVEGANQILALDMKMLDESFYDIDVEASIVGADKQNIYFVDNYNSQNGMLYYISAEDPDYMSEQQIWDTPLENRIITYCIGDMIYCAVYTNEGQQQGGSTEIYMIPFNKLILMKTVNEPLSFLRYGIVDGKILLPQEGASISLQ